MHLTVAGPRGLTLRCRVATTRRDRARGLIGVGSLAPDEALLIPDATSVHTFGMRMPILLARLDTSLRVVDVRLLPPRRIALPKRRARHVLEGPTALDLRVGDVLRPVRAGRSLGPEAADAAHRP